GLVPGDLGEAFGHQRAVRPEAAEGVDRHLRPGAVADAGHEVVAVAGVGDLLPGADPLDLLPQARALGGFAARLGVGTEVEEHALALVRVPAGELVLAHV